jgi:hypothetical protein
METSTVQSDKGIGFALLFSIVALLGAVAMVAAPDQLGKAYGFAIAMLAASFAVVAIHVFW